MAYAVVTKSLTVYQVQDGKVLRFGFEQHIAGIPITWPWGEARRLVGTPDKAVEGERWRFEYRDEVSGRAVAISTSEVSLVAPVVASGWRVEDVEDLVADVLEDVPLDGSMER